MGIIDFLSNIVKKVKQKNSKEETKTNNSGSKTTAAVSSAPKPTTKPSTSVKKPTTLTSKTPSKGTSSTKAGTNTTAKGTQATSSVSKPTVSQTAATNTVPVATPFSVFSATAGTQPQEKSTAKTEEPKQEEQVKAFTIPLSPLRKGLALPQRIPQLNTVNTNTFIETSLKNDIQSKRAPYSENDVRDVYDVDAGGMNVNGNTKYSVNTVTAVDYKHVAEGLSSGTMEVWLVEEGDSIKTTKYANRSVENGSVTTAVNTIGADRLYGISPEDKYVLYDPATKKFYRYAQSDSVDEKRRTIESYTTQMSEYTNDYVNNIAAKYNQDIEQLDAVLQPLIDKAEVEALTDAEYALFQATWEKRQEVVGQSDAAYDEYAAKYSAVLERYNTASADLKGIGITGKEVERYYYLKSLKDAYDKLQKDEYTDADVALLMETYGSLRMSEEDITALDELSRRMSNTAQNTVYMNEDYRNALNDYVGNIRTEVDAYEQDASVYADFNSTTQVNSFLDVAKRAISRAAWGQFKDTTFMEDLAEAWSYKTTSIADIATSADASLGKVANAVIKNTLVELGETSDRTNIFMSFIVGSNNYLYGNYDNPELNVFIRNQTQKEWETLSDNAKSFWEPVAGSSTPGRSGIAEYAGWVTFKAWLGAYGETPNFEYSNAVSPEESNAGTVMTTLALELLFDPGVWFDVGKAAVKGSVVADALSDVQKTGVISNLVDQQYTVWRQAGASILYEDILGKETTQQLADSLAKNGKLAIVRNANTEQVITNAYKNAIKTAYGAGGKSKIIADALTQASSKTTEEMFGKAIRKVDDTVNTYLQSVQSLDVVAKKSHKEALQKFTGEAAKTTAQNIAKIVEEDGSAMAKLIYQAPSVLGTMHKLDVVESFVNTTLLAVAAPTLAVPVAAVRGIKTLITKTTNLAAAKLAAESVGTITKKLSTLADSTKAYSDNVSEAVKEITEHTSVLYNNAGYTPESYKFFKEFEENALRAYADHVLSDTLNPIKHILVEPAYDPITRINKLNEFAVTKGFPAFKEFNEAIMRNVGIFSDMSSSAKAMYAEFQRLYRSAVAAKNIEGTQQLIQKVYSAGTTNITQQLDNVLQNVDTLTELQNMHTTVQVMRDQFVDLVTDVNKQAYSDAADTVIAAIKDVGDDADALTNSLTKQTELYDAVSSFCNLTEEYITGLNEHIGKIRTANYIHRDPQEYVSSITAKHTQIQRTRTNAVAEGVRKELQRKHGLNVSAEEVQRNLVHDTYKDILFDADGNLDAEGLGRIYQVQLDKYTSALQWVSDDAMRKVVDDVLDNNTEVNCALQNLYTELQTVLYKVNPTEQSLIELLQRQLADINAFVDQCARQKHTRLLFDNFESYAAENGVAAKQVNAVLDAMAGDKAHRINSNAIAYMDTHNQRCVDNIVDSIVDDATEYLREISETPIDYLWHKQCNTVNTANNVRRIVEEAKGVVPADDAFIDVYYSAAGTVRGADPHMISFQVDGVVDTFRNADSPFMMHDSHALRMYGKDCSEVTAEYMAVCNQVPGMSKIEYAQNIQRYMLQLNQQATEQGKQLRFIGFNCGAATSEADKFIKNFFISNNIGVRWNSSIDVAEIIRQSKGMESLSDSAVAAIRRAVTDTLISARTNKYLHNVSGALIMNAEKPFTSVADGLNTTVEHIKTFMATCSADTQRVLNNLFTGIERTQSVINESRKYLGGTDIGKLLSEREIAEFINTATLSKSRTARINNMRALYGTLSDVRNVSSGSYGLKKMLDMHNASEWFNVDVLTQLLDGVSNNTIIATRIEQLAELTRGLDNHYQLVNNPELLEAIGVDAYRELYDVVLTMVQHHPKIVGSEVAVLLSELKLTTAQDYFSALMYMQRKYAYAFPDLEDVKKQINNLKQAGVIQSKTCTDALLTIHADTANALVYNSAHTMHRFGTAVDLVETRYATVNERTVYTHALMQDAMNAAKEAESLGTYLDLKEAAYRAGGYSTAKERIQYELFSKVYEPYLNLVDRLDVTGRNFGDVVERATEVGVTPILRASYIHEYDAEIASRLRDITAIGSTHKSAAIAAALTLSDTDFEKYVVRNCMNALVIDPNASMFSGELGVLLGKRLDTISNSTGLTAERFTKLDVNGNAHEYIRVYKDLADVDVDKLFTELWHEDVPLFEAYRGAYFRYTDLGVVETLNGSQAYADFNRYMKQMSQCMPERYFGSTLDVLTQDTMAALQADFPEVARINPRRVKDWFDEAYNCSMWGDLDMRRMYDPYASDKLLDNMGRGLHHVQHKMEATANILNMFRAQNFRDIVHAVGAENESWKVIKQQLDSRGYVLAVIKPTATGSYTVTKMPLDSARTFKKYLQSDAVVCVENSVFNHLNAAMHTKNKLALYNRMHGNIVTGALSDMCDTWARTVRSARITGTLFLSNFKGTGIRNVLDSTLKGYNDAGAAFLKHVNNAIEYQRGYDEVYAAIVEKYYDVNSTSIAKYFSENNGTVIDEDLFTKLHVLNELASSDSSVVYDVIKSNELPKMRGLLADSAQYTDDTIKDAMSIFNRVHAQSKYTHIPGELKYTVQTEMHDKVLELLSKKYAPDQAKELAELFYHYTPTATTWGQKLEKVPGVGALLKTNSKTFSNAETRTRTALYLAYVDELGQSVNKAEQAIVRTQFDYSNRSGFLNSIEKLLPFSTFKVYNANYWMTEAPKKYTTLKNITKLSMATDRVYDAQEIANIIRNQHVTELIYNQSAAAQEDDPTDGVRQWWQNSIVGYRGVPDAYAQGLRIGDNHVLKIGNSFIDAITLTASLFYAPLQIKNGQLPSIIADSMYAPLAILWKFIADYRRDDRINPTDVQYNTNPEGSTDPAAWAVDNAHDVINLVPAYGSLVSMVLTHIKNGCANLADFKAMMCDESLRDAYVHKVFESMIDGAGIIFPSFVGILYDQPTYFEREVGLNWSNNTDPAFWMTRVNPDTGEYYTEEEAIAAVQQYRDTHQYVYGVSSVPSFMVKDPATYINYSAMFVKWGFDEADVKEHLGTLLKQLYGGGFEQDAATNGVFFNADGKGGTYLNSTLINGTLAALAAKGYSVEEAIACMKSEKWYNPYTGQFVTDTELYKEIANSAFLDVYERLPEYMRYDKDQYSQLVAYWKSTGLTTQQAWMMMQTENGFIDEQGHYHVLTDEQVAQYTKQLNDDYYEFTAALPDWYKYETGAATRTINYLTSTGMSKEQAYKYILDNNFYIDEDGVHHYFSDEECAAKTAASSKAFEEYYSALPEYIKYEKGAYGRTLAYLKEVEGVDTDTAKAMIANGAYLTVDGRLINCLDMQREYTAQRIDYLTDEEFTEYFQSLPDYIKYEKGAYKRTYDALKAMGHDYTTTLELIKQGAYITVDGKLINCLGMQRERSSNWTTYLSDDAFAEYFQSLPDYIKYEKGAYKRTYAALKELGFDYTTALALIKQGAYLMPVDLNSTALSVYQNVNGVENIKDINALLQACGNQVLFQDNKAYTIVNCSGLVRMNARGGYYSNKYYNNYTQYKRYVPKAPKIKRAIRHYTNPVKVKKPFVTSGSYSSTYSKVNVLAGASYGARKVYKVTLGFNPVRQSLSIKSSYPTAYRNIVYGHRRNMYKELYAKYGTSRILMRANSIHSYSNASITKLRRNEIQTRIRYANRRSNF